MIQCKKLLNAIRQTKNSKIRYIFKEPVTADKTAPGSQARSPAVYDGNHRNSMIDTRIFRPRIIDDIHEKQSLVIQEMNILFEMLYLSSQRLKGRAPVLSTKTLRCSLPKSLLS